MARKRMLDPHIWETAYDKKWTCEDFAVFCAAISAADDEGYGRTSMIKRNLGHMISDRKMKKVLEKLNNSISFFGKIYFFLPNWTEYQKISHMSPSKIKKLTDRNFNNLGVNPSGSIHGAAPKKDDAIELNLKEGSLKELKETESNSLNFPDQLKKLFQDHTHIQDPNEITFIKPLMDLRAEPHPMAMTDQMIDQCFFDTFKNLKKENGIKIDYLIDNIKKKMAAEHEKLTTAEKSGELAEAAKHRIEQSAQDATDLDNFRANQLQKYVDFFQNNQSLFSAKDKNELKKILPAGRVIAAGVIIEPKMSENQRF